jgi:hypothetical protein
VSNNQTTNKETDMNSDPYIYRVLRVYNLLAKRDRMRTCDTYLEAMTLAKSLNAQAADTSYMYIIVSEPRRKKASK